MQLHARMTCWRVVSILSLVALITSGCGGKKTEDAGDRILLIYVPCGMEMPFQDLARAFAAEHPGARVDLLLDNADILAQRVIERGRKPDAMVSPGTVELGTVIKAGYVVPEDVTHFGQYELVLFGPRENPGEVTTFADLATGRVSAIAVADPDKTSVGFYTREALKNLGLWEQVRGKVVITADPSMAYKHVARSKVQASFAYRSCPLKTAPDKLDYSRVRIFESVPAELYGPAYASIALLKDSPNRDLGDAFIGLLLSESGRAILDTYEVPCLAEPATPR